MKFQYLFLGLLVSAVFSGSAKASGDLNSRQLKREFSSGQTITTTVSSITDGDTIRFNYPKLKTTIPLRFAVVNTPEMRGNYSRGEIELGKRARDELLKFIQKDSRIIVRVSPQVEDGGNRLVGEILLPKDSESVNVKMLKGGWGVVDCRFLYNAGNAQGNYLVAESQAAKIMSGIWARNTPSWSGAKAASNAGKCKYSS
ncbi:hypothetical protein CAL7716_101180 (plasmid) [Calothrix sp. PCC 7716]|nr:hypothetical protein CAL7716_101180 [Calothrix sp. PCC 7716]